MFDLVLNHASRKGRWFAHYLADTGPGRGYFIEVGPTTDLRAVVRPRATPLLAEMVTVRGTRHLWATFSDDQIDLNFANPAVLSEFIDLFVASQAISMALAGIPALYFHSLVGTHNDLDGVEQSGHGRSINRRRYDASEITYQLSIDSHHARVLARLKRLLTVRARQPAFHPDAAQEIIDLGPRLFAVQRTCKEQTLLAVHNVSARAVKVPGNMLPEARVRRNVTAATQISGAPRSITIAPYEIAWDSD